jgi:hypothetical protein
MKPCGAWKVAPEGRVGDGRALVQKPRQTGSWRQDRGLHGLKLELVGVTQLGANRGTYPIIMSMISHMVDSKWLHISTTPCT